MSIYQVGLFRFGLQSLQQMRGGVQVFDPPLGAQQEHINKHISACNACNDISLVIYATKEITSLQVP